MAKGASLTKIRTSDLHVSRPTWWLESRFHFNFADWWQGKERFGCLRVLNDDLVKPLAGFGSHSHRDAEIFSYVVDGELTHQDSIGNKESLGRGAVQYMSAGTGVIHSEMNDHPKDICRFLQVWLLPDRPGHVPQYGSLNTISAQRHNSLLAVLQGTGNIPDWAVPIHSDDDPIRLHQDATVVVSETDPEFRQRIRLGKSRQAYIVCIEGTLDLVPEIPLQQNDSTSGVSLEMREAVEVVPADTGIALDLVAGGQGAHVMIIEMGKDTVQR